MRWSVNKKSTRLCILGIFTLLSSAQSQIVMTREEAGKYALRAAIALNTSVRWLTTSELPAGEEVADTEQDNIDAYALMGLDYEDIVSITTFAYNLPIHPASHWLGNVYYRYPCEHGQIWVNVFSGQVIAQGNFPTGVAESLTKEQAKLIASNIINTFYGKVDHEWDIKVSINEESGHITVYFRSFKLSIGLKFGRRYSYIEFSSQGSVYIARFDTLPEIITLPKISIEQAKQIIVNAFEEAYTTGKETYLVILHTETQKEKLPQARFICFGKHPEAIDPKHIDSLLFLPTPGYIYDLGEGIYYYCEDDFLHPIYVYAIIATIEVLGYKVWTYYLVNIDTGEIEEGFGLKDIILVFFSGISIINKKQDLSEVKQIRSIYLNNEEIELKRIFFKNNRIYIAQDYLPVFKTELRDSMLYGRNGGIHLAPGELQWFKGKAFVALRRVCEVSGIRLWWDNLRKVPILQAEWLEPIKLVARRR